MEYLAACPLCQETRLSHYTSCKDYTVSHETFELQQCSSCGFVFTNPRPTDQQLPQYYQSEAYISHSNTSRRLLDRIYKVARRFTLKWKFDLIVKYSLNRPENLLDYGCGTGAFLQQCQQEGMKVAGVEPAATARALAETLTGTAIAETLTDIKGMFNVITLWHVLEHVTNLHQTMQQLTSLLHRNGTMFIAVPNLASADAQYYKNTWAAYDVPRHLWHFSRHTMSTLFTSHNLRIDHIVPMQLDSYYVSLLSEKYQRQKQDPGSIASAVVQGWRSNQKAKTTGEYSSLIYIVRK